MLSVQVQIQVTLFRLKDKAGKNGHNTVQMLEFFATTCALLHHFCLSCALLHHIYDRPARCYTTFTTDLRAATPYGHSQLRAGTPYLCGGKSSLRAATPHLRL